MYLLRFLIPNENKKMLLHDGENFVWGRTYEMAEYESLKNSAKAVSVGGFDIVKVTEKELAEMVGTTVENPSYKILVVHGGLVPFYGVEIVKDNIP